MTLNFGPMTMTFDLGPWTFVVSRLCHNETLYEISAQSGNPRRSYCSLNFDLVTLNMYHVLSLCCGIVCTKFKLSQAIRSWNVTIFFTLVCDVMLWTWPLTPWPLPLTFDLEHLWWAGCAVMKLCTKFQLNRTICGADIAFWSLTLWPWTCITCSRYALG